MHSFHVEPFLVPLSCSPFFAAFTHQTKTSHITPYTLCPFLASLRSTSKPIFFRGKTFLGAGDRDSLFPLALNSDSLLVLVSAGTGVRPSTCLDLLTESLVGSLCSNSLLLYSCASPFQQRLGEKGPASLPWAVS